MDSKQEVLIISTKSKPIKIVYESGSKNKNLGEYFLNLNKPLTEEEIERFLDLVKGG